MDKYEFRRLALKRLVSSIGHGGQAKIAKETGIAADYVSRLLYEAGKRGKKNIGEETVEVLNAKFPGWLDVDLYDVEENIFTSRRKSDREKSIQTIVKLLREMGNEGIEIVLHSATLMYEKYPLNKEIPSSQ